MVLAARALAQGHRRRVARCRAATTRKGALYRSFRRASLPAAAARSPTPATAPCRRWSRCPARRSTPEPAAEKGFKIERLYYTLDGERGRSHQGQAERALRRGAEDHRAGSRSSAASSSPTICRRASRSTIRGSSRRARPARCRGSRTPRSRRTRSSATTASARRSTARAERPGGVHGRLCGARGVARPLRAAAGLCRGHVPAGPLRPHRHRHDRDRGGEVSDDRKALAATHRRRQSLALAVVAALAALAGGAWWVRLARPGAARRGRRILDRRWSTATAVCCGPMRRRTAAGGCRRRSTTSIRASRYAASPTRTGASASTTASIRWRWRARRCNCSRNGRIVSGGSTLTMQVARLLEPRAERTLARQAAPDRARHRDRAQPEQGRGARALSDARALRRQSRRHARGVARLFRQGAEAAFARRSGAAGRAAAIAGGAPAGPLGRCRARARATACSTASPRPA